ncbi:MAG: DNA topoisomerase IV subunit A [Candidatus Aenigmarchaeota archaeon]|nr:DNA topoisomerase IV subunit A [Candidatus Aenigmarchaeota archaeon]
MKKNTSAQKLEKMGKDLVKEIEQNKNPSLEIPVRSLSNTIFDKKQNILTLGNNTSKRHFFNISHIKKFVQTIEAAATAKELVEVQKHLSLREVYYRIKRTLPGTNIDLVDQQEDSNKAIEDLELITSLSREQLHINANKMGSVAGNVVVKDKGDLVNWAKLGSGGWSIPSNVEEIEFKSVDAEFVIYMEKAAEWERLHEDKVWKRLNCIIMSSQGQSTRGVRRLLQRLNVEHKLPVYVLTDFDPWGFYIYSVLKFGSISLAHISDRLTIPNARFLGLTGDDIENFDLKKHIIKFKEVDAKRLKDMGKYDWFKDHKEWKRQFQLMKQINGKVELAALSSKGISFISDEYIPEKIKKKDWII